MSVIMTCPISTCDWDLESDDALEQSNAAASPAIAAAMGIPVDAFTSIREHQLATSRERDLDRHLSSHPLVDWVRDLMAARTAAAQALGILRSPDSPRVSDTTRQRDAEAILDAVPRA